MSVRKTIPLFTGIAVTVAALTSCHSYPIDMSNGDKSACSGIATSYLSADQARGSLAIADVYATPGSVIDETINRVIGDLDDNSPDFASDLAYLNALCGNG